MALSPWMQYWNANPDLAAAHAQNSYGLTPEQFAQTHYQKYGQGEGRASNGITGLASPSDISIGANAAGYADAGAIDQYQGALGANTGHRAMGDGSYEVDNSGWWANQPRQAQPFSGGQYSGWQNTVARQRGQLPPAGGVPPPDMGTINPGSGYRNGPGGTTMPQVLPGVANPADPFSGFRVGPADAQITAGGISGLMNPFLQSVRDQTMTDIERQRVLAQTGTDDAARAARAFGGDRHGVANALTNDAFARQAAQQYAGLNAAGYNAAAGLATQNAANNLTARGQDIGQNQGFMGGALSQRAQDIGYGLGQQGNLLQQRGQDMNYNLGMAGQQLNAYNVANSLMNSSGLMDWLSVNQGSNAAGGGSNTTQTNTTPGADPWNSLIGGLLTGWSLTRGG